MTALPTHTRLRPPGRTVALVAGAGLATAAGIAFTASVPPLPGTEQLGVEDIVDAMAGVAAGVLGSVLVRRQLAAGLGRALLALAVLVGGIWLTGGLADLLASGGTPAPAARALQMLAAVLFIGSYALLVIGPLLLFPDGRLVGRAARALGWLAVGATGVSMLALLLRPGPVDEDVPAWGVNPFGVDALAPATGAATAVGLAAMAAVAVGALVVFLVRLVRGRGVARRQMLWFLLGVVPMVATLVSDEVLPGALSAAVVFAALYGSMAWALLGPPARRPDGPAAARRSDPGPAARRVARPPGAPSGRPTQ